MDPYSRVMDIAMPDAADGTEAPDATTPMEGTPSGQAPDLSVFDIKFYGELQC